MKKGKFLLSAFLLLFLMSATRSNAATVAQNAATFTGAGYLRSQLNTQQFRPDAAFTYELWFKADAEGALVNEVHQFTESLWDYNFLEVDTQGKLIAAVPGIAPITGPTIQFGTWHHAAIRYNATTKDLDLFLDGTKVGSSNGTRLLPWDAGHTVFMTFGRSVPGRPSLRGQIDEVRLWKPALTDAEIAANRRLKLSNADTRLFAMWSLDVIEGSSEGFPTTPDRSGNSNPALLVGSVTLTPSAADLENDPLPAAVTGAAAVGQLSATLRGAASSTTAGITYFRYGRNGALDQSTPSKTIPAGENIAVEAIVEGLSSRTSYSYALVVSNDFGLNQGATRTFISADLRPVAVTSAAQDSGGTSTIVTGTAISPIVGFAHFIWGEAELTNRTPEVSVSAGTNSFQATLENLVGGRAYRYALVVTNEAGASTGLTRTFTKIAPSVAAQAATFAGTGYLRSQFNTQQFFKDAAFTFELWFKANSAGALINEVHQFTESLWDYNFLEVDSQGRLIAAVPGVSPITGPSVQFETWHHAAIRYNPATQDLDLFLDGTKVGSNKGTRLLPWNAGHTVFMTFGRSKPGRPSLRGQIDEVRMWKTVLSDSDIAANRDLKLAGPDARLFAMWSLDSIQGNSEGYPTTPDRSGNNNPALLVGNVTLTASGAYLIPAPTVALKAATFNGTGYLRSQYNTQQFFKNAAFTFELWFQADAAGALINEVHQFTESLWDYNFLEVDTQGRLIASVPGVSAITGPSVQFGSWHHAALRYDPGTQNLDLFLDGTKAGTSQGARRLPWDAGHTVFMTFARSVPGRPWLRGQVDEVRMWRSALSDGEIAAARRLRLANPDGRLFAMWSLDVIEGSSEGYPTSPDRSGNNNPALLVGSVTLTPSGADLINDQRPSATTGDAALSTANATLNGFATSQSEGIAFFRYGRSALDRTTDSVTIGNNNSASVQKTVGPLEAGAYSYVLVASNQFGITEGTVRTFTIQGPPPAAVTGAFDDSPGAAGVVNGIATTAVAGTAYFIWGVDQLNNGTQDIALGGSQSAVPVEAVLNNLEAGKTYRYALVVKNPYGTRTGEIQTFTKVGWAGSAVVLTGSAYIRTFNDQRPFFSDETITAELWIKPARAGVVLAEVDRIDPQIVDSSIIEILASGDVVAGFPGVSTISIGHVEMNEWNHVAIRYDSTTQLLEGWVNGDKSANTSSGDRVAGWEFGQQIVYTFAKGAADRIGTGEHLDGQFDEIRLWKSARTDAQIAENYSKKLVGTEAGMVAYYRFDDRRTTIGDDSRHNNIAQIVAAADAGWVVSAARASVSVQPIARTVDDGVRVQFTGLPGRQLRLRITSDFATWTDGPIATVDELGVATFAVSSSGANHLFFAVQNL